MNRHLDDVVAGIVLCSSESNRSLCVFSLLNSSFHDFRFPALREYTPCSGSAMKGGVWNC